MFVGDNLREAVEKTIGNLHPPLRKRLKFMVSAKQDETTTPKLHPPQQIAGEDVNKYMKFPANNTI